MMSSPLRQLYSNSGWGGIGRILAIALVLLVNGLIARLLEPDEVGQYFLIFSLVTITSIAAQLGLNQAIVRLVSEQLSKGKVDIARYIAIRSVKTVLLSVIAISVIAIVVAGYFSEILRARWSLSMTTVVLILLWFALLTYQSILVECFRAYHRIRQSIIFGGVLTNFALATLMTSYWSIHETGTINWILALTLVAVAINLGFSQVLYNKITRSKGVAAADTRQDIMSVARPIWYTNLTLIILVHADIWIIGAFLTASDVALYGAAARLAAFVGLPLMVINSVISPVITDLYYRKKKPDLQRVAGVAATLASIPALGIGLLYLGAGSELLALVFGNFYKDAYLVLLILGAGQCFNVLAGSCGLVLMMTGHHHLMLKITVVTSFSAILLSVVVAYLGRNAIHIAIIFASALIIQNLLMLFFAYRRTGIMTFANFRFGSLKP